MAWVRYDDQFYANAKVTAVIAEDAGALALHVLANTWTNGQKRMGFIPKHQPGVLICDRSQGQTWAEVLTRHGLWHECGHECEACQEEYADLPPDSVGYVIHNAKVYRAPARERTTPGTAAELSEKRREAGRRGGQASAARRNGTNESKGKQNEASGQANQANQANTGSAPATAAAEEKRSGVTSRLAEGDFSRPAETQQDPQASQANGVSKTSKLLVAGVTPVPGSSSNEEELPEHLFASNEAKVPPTAGTATPRRDSNKPINAGAVIAAYMDGAKAAGLPTPAEELRGRIGKQARTLLADKNTDHEALLVAARNMGAGGWNSLAVQIQRDAAEKKAQSPSSSNGSGSHIDHDTPLPTSVRDL